MYKYMINSPIKKIYVELKLLSRNINCNCEIFDADTDSEFYIGSLSAKKIAYIASEIADYSLNNYELRSEKELEPHRLCIALCRKWLNDPDSVSLNDIRGAAFEDYNSLFYLSNYSVSVLGCIQGGDNTKIESYFYNVVYGPICAIRYLNSNRRTHLSFCDIAEYERQGQFIVDFLLSDKSLFMV